MKKGTHTFEDGRSFRFGKFTMGLLRDLKDAEEAGDKQAYGEQMLVAAHAAVARATPGFTRRQLEDLLDADEIGELFVAILSFTRNGETPAQGEAVGA